MSKALETDWPEDAVASSDGRAADSPAGPMPRVLMIAHRTPYPPDKGDRIRSYHVLRYFSRRADVDLVTLADEPISRETDRALRGLARTVEVVPVEPRMRWLRAATSVLRGRSATEGLFESRDLRRRLKEMTANTEYDLVVVVCSGMAQYLAHLNLGAAKVLVDLIDVDSEKWFDYAASGSGWRRLAHGLEGRRVRRLEAEIADQVDQVAVVSDAEAACLRSFHPAANVVAIPNGVDFDYFRPDDATVVDAHSCVFVGALDYKPNIDGVMWYCKTVWADVRALHPDAQFSIVGRRPGDAVRRLADIPGVQVIADVTDVRPYLRRAGIVVAPLQIARGIQNKVLEALATGKSLIATRQAIQGLDVTAGEHLYQAESPGEWTAAIHCLMSSESDRRRLGAAGRAFVSERHHWESCLHGLGDLLSPSSVQR